MSEIVAEPGQGQAISGNSEASQTVAQLVTGKKPRPTKEELLARFGRYATKPFDRTGFKQPRKPKPLPTPVPEPVVLMELPEPITALTQFVESQSIIYNLIQKNKDDPKLVPALTSALASLEDRRQVLLGVGKPKPVEASNDPTKQAKRKPASSTGFVPAPKP